VENDKTASWYFDHDGGQRRAIMLAIQRQPGTNTVEVVDNIKQLLLLSGADAAFGQDEYPL